MSTQLISRFIQHCTVGSQTFGFVYQKEAYLTFKTQCKVSYFVVHKSECLRAYCAALNNIEIKCVLIRNLKTHSAWFVGEISLYVFCGGCVWRGLRVRFWADETYIRVVLSGHALSNRTLHEPGERWEHIHWRVDLLVV